MLIPQLAAYKIVNGSVTVAGVGAGATVTQEINLPSGYVLVGMPSVSTDTPNAEVKVVNGGLRKFTVEITNNDAAAQDVVVDYECIAVRTS